ncbi:MAG: transposase [Planctomycetes bacterium]|nr:transposase [Planctomycetota bacterium]
METSRHKSRKCPQTWHYISVRVSAAARKSPMKSGCRPRQARRHCPSPAKRWIVERSIAWLNRCRRLAKDWECLNRSGLAFLRWASVRLMVRKLCQASQ